MDLVDKPVSEEDERKMKNLATRIMSNGVEVLVKDKNGDPGKNEQTKFMEVKTVQPSVINNIYHSNLPKIEKRVDDEQDSNEQSNFDLIQPSEPGHTPCTSSCSCSHTKTEGLKTKYNSDVNTFKKLPLKTSKYGATKLEVRPTGIDKKSQYEPYEYESSSQSAPIDKIVEKYTEVINDYSDEKDSGSVEESELLTNEQAPSPPKTNKVTNKNPEKAKPEKPQKPHNKNKFVVADLLKLGTLGIKGLSQLAPVIEKMTGGFMKRQDTNKTTPSTTVKPVTKLTPYQVNKRIDSDIESKQSNFPIYIPVDEMETSESQMVFTNATLHQNLAWAAEYKHSKAHMTKMVHESPLVNGGIPISPGEIITANSDVIVGKPAVGGPLTLAASGIRLQNPVNPPPLDSFVSSNEHYVVKERPDEQSALVDDSFDLRPPELPKLKAKPVRNLPRPSNPPPKYHEQTNNGFTYQSVPNKASRPFSTPHPSDNVMKTEQIQTNILGNHGRPAFLDFIPSLGKPESNTSPLQQNIEFKPFRENNDDPEVSDNSPSSSEQVDTKVKTNGEFVSSNQQSPDINKPFLVDIQPSRVANVIIPHGSSTALVFTGSSEPHKTGDYVDDPLPYPEPGYFGSFSIDAPQMTNVHNVPPNNNRPSQVKPNFQHQIESHVHHNKDHGFRNELKPKWQENKRPVDYSKLPPPTSKQESHFQYGPQITVYNPEVYKPSGNGKFEKYDHKHNKDGKEIIDKDYENYLAVPPPPPPKKPFNSDNRPYSQKPIVHTKPVQDMKVFLNIQHPVPKQPNQQAKPQNQDPPPKVTSEIYFAAQTPQNTHAPTYTVHIPNGQNMPQNNYYQGQNVRPPTNNMPNQFQTQNFRPEQDSFTVISSPTHNVKPGYISDVNVKEHTYTVTLNTATNVATNVGENNQVVGSSVPVSIGSNSANADIPIGTNFAIGVEGGPSQQIYDIPVQGNRSPPVFYNEHGQGQSPIEISVGDNRWNTTDSRDEVKIETSTTISSTPEYIQNTIPFHKQNIADTSSRPSVNSHANFPMMNEYSNSGNENVKPVVEFVEDIKPDQKRPAKLIPNIPTNSHGWYSSAPINELNTINNIKLQATTRKAIPLLFEYNHHSLPKFGQKITSVGKPPSEFWAQNSPGPQIDTDQHYEEQNNQTPSDQNIQSTSKPFLSNYIPHNFGVVRQPVYDIPIRDNSDETTTTKVSPATDKRKPIYEDAHAIYDGEEESDSNESDGEISQESIKVPVVTSSEEADNKREESKSSTEITLLQDEVVNNNKQKETNVQLVEFNAGTQTEKPFDAETYNKTNNFQTNSIKPIYENNPLNRPRPRPFTVNTATTLDHQLQQPHWQINQMVENATNISVEENIDLNIGEEMNFKTTTKPSTTRIPYRHQNLENKNKRPQRPIFSLRGNDSNIITSTVHIQDKKPLTVMEDSDERSSTLPSITSGNFDLNRSSSEILDLSPPPPTMDYSFKPSTADEMIMGMSPPPPGNSVPSMRPLPTRSPITSKPLPGRTPPPYRTNKPRTTRPTQRPTRKPVNRDDVSTYRPSYDTINNGRRPIFDHDQPSSQLLPPPREEPSRIIPINEKPSIAPSVPNLVFPTPISSGWLTSSGVEFSSSFGFGATPIHFPASEASKIPQQPSTDKSYSYETEPSSTERIDEISSEKPVSNEESTSKESSTENSNKSEISSEETNASDSALIETNQEDSSSDKKVIPLRNKNRTRKPYPGRDEDKKSSVVKYKLPPSRPTPNIKPTRTLRPELYPTRQTSIRKIVRPLPTRTSTIIRPSIIESSESFIDDGEIQPSEVHKDNEIPSLQQSEKPSNGHNTPYLENSIVHDSDSAVIPLVKPTHHAGNEVKVSDEIVPTKTEFRTTVITLTKTLSEPPRTVSSIGYVNLTHTLTVTHTKTSLVSQSEGAITQTLVLTNTHTSTIVDVVTEIYTQVQPTTIIETVTKHIPIPQIEPTPVHEVPTKTKTALDDLTMSSEERENFVIHDSETTENIQKIDQENENDTDTFFVVMNKSQNGGPAPSESTDIETGDYEGITRNEQVNSNGVSQVLFGEILLAGTPYLETANVVNPTGVAYGKECQPDCKASRNERCQRIDGIMKCVCRPGFARMFPDRPCKPTYTYSVKLALSSQGTDRLHFHSNLADNSSNQYHSLALATHEGINRMVMQSDLRDVYHGVHINGFHPVEMKVGGEAYQGVMNDFYVQLSDNAHESRLKEVIEKYLRTNNYSLGGTEVFAASELMDRLNVSDFDECVSGQFHDCSEHAQCFNLRGTYTCSCLEGYADLSVNPLYPGRICSAEPVGCERCNYHGACYSRDDRRVLCECFQWYAGSTCHINLKVVLISLVTVGALLTVVLVICAVVACSKRPRPPPRSIVTCIQAMPSLHQGAQPSKQRADRRALITGGADSGDASSIQNASLPYMPAKVGAPAGVTSGTVQRGWLLLEDDMPKQSSSSKKMIISEPPAHEAPPPPPAPAVMIPRARLHPPHRDSREMASRKQSLELSSEAKLISYLESGANISNDEMMRRKHSMESSYSAPKGRPHGNKQGALVSAGFKVSTTIRPDDPVMMKDDRDDLSSITKNDLEAELHFDSLRKSYSQEDISEWTDAERRIGELTLSEARSVGGTLPASTGRAASSTRLTHQEANTMAERDLGSTFLLPHVHLYKPDITSDVSEFDSL